MNYMTYFRRAAVYLALGKSKSALPDLDYVIGLRPDFTKVSSNVHVLKVEFDKKIKLGLILFIVIFP